jgi:hypothetical protein
MNFKHLLVPKFFKSMSELVLDPALTKESEQHIGHGGTSAAICDHFTHKLD